MKDFLIAGTITRYNTTGYLIGERPHPSHNFQQFSIVFNNFVQFFTILYSF